MAPLVVDPSGYLKPHHSVGHCRVGWGTLLLLGRLLRGLTAGDHHRGSTQRPTT